MRPEPPPVFRASAIDRPSLRALLSTGARMALRNLLRRPVRTALSVLGVALAVAIVVLVGGMNDSLDHLTLVQFEEVQRSDATVIFADARRTAAVREIGLGPGVLRAEPFRAVAVTLRHGHLSYRTAVMGLARDGELRRLVDAGGRAIPIPDEGAVLSRVIAQKLAVAPGDALEVELLEGAMRTRRIHVAGVVDDLLGAGATMDRDALDRLVGGPPLATGVEIRADARREAEVLAGLRRTAQVASVTLRRAALRSFRETLDQSMRVMSRVEIAFAVIIAVAVVFNGARAALSERARELATLRVLGFTDAEAAAVLLGELAAVTALAQPLGLALGYALAIVLVDASASDLLRLPFVILPRTLSSAALVVTSSALISALVVGARVGRLDLVAVLKTRD